MVEREAPPTWQELQALAVKNGWYEGPPKPIDGLSLILEDRHPAGRYLEFALNGVGRVRFCRDQDVDETASVRNRWRAAHLGYKVDVVMVQRGGRVEAYLSAANAAAGMLIDTLRAAWAWEVESEQRAVEKLRELLPAHAWRAYVLTGTFLETSRRSGVTYLFRKLRPTLAIRPTADGERTRILCALCLHPLGYYQGTWAGAMVPTDDVIAHLLLMRGDEPRYWRQANQIEPHYPEAGIF